MNDICLLSNSQYGFRNNCSTCYALIDLHEQLTKLINDKLCTIGVFIDLIKASDTIDYLLLLQKLNRYGIRGIANPRVSSFVQVTALWVWV